MADMNISIYRNLQQARSRMSSSYEESPCVLAGTLSRLHTQALQARLGPHRATAAQYPVLEQLWILDGQTQSALCRRLNVEQPTLANTLARMVRDQLVRKIKDNNDRRQVIIKLTKRGRELQHVLSGSVAEVNEAALSGLSPEEVQLHAELSRRMIHNLRLDLDQPPIMLDDSLELAPTDHTSIPEVEPGPAHPHAQAPETALPPAGSAASPPAEPAPPAQPSNPAATLQEETTELPETPDDFRTTDPAMAPDPALDQFTDQAENQTENQTEASAQGQDQAQGPTEEVVAHATPKQATAPASDGEHAPASPNENESVGEPRQEAEEEVLVLGEEFALKG